MPHHKRHRKERTSTNHKGRSGSRENTEESPGQSNRRMSSQPRPQQQKRSLREVLGFSSRVPAPPEKQVAEMTYEGDPVRQASERPQSPYASNGYPTPNMVTVLQPTASANTQHGSTLYNASQSPRSNVDFSPLDTGREQLYSHPSPMHIAPTNKDSELHHPDEGSNRQTAIPRGVLSQDTHTPYFGGTFLQDEIVSSHFAQLSQRELNILV
jgi:hypothetical protein